MESAADVAVQRVRGRRLGIVATSAEIAWRDSLPRLHVSVATGSSRRTDRESGQRALGAGVSSDPHLARLAAISEVVERYVALAPVPPERLQRCSHASQAGDAMGARHWALLSKGQYATAKELRPLTDNKVIDWCTAYSLTTGRSVAVPAALVHFSVPKGPPNDFLPELTSTGTACHISTEEALLAGLCEVLERDALMIAWMNRLVLRPIEPAGTVLEDFIESVFGESEIGIGLFDLPTDAPFPVVLAVGWGHAGLPRAVVGAACRADHQAAATKALCEVAQVLYRLHYRPAPPPTTMRTLDDHAGLYAAPGGDALLRHAVGIGDPLLLAQLPSIRPRPAAAHLADLVDDLERLGLQVLAVDLTTSDVAEAGFRVVRVMVPGTMDINVDGRYPRLGGRRLYELPVKLGIRDEALTEAELNPLPVPLA